MDGLFESEVEGVADECVSDADLVGPWNLLVEVGEVLEAEVVAGVETESEGTGSLRRTDEGCYGRGAVGSIGGSIGLGVELYAVCSGTLGVVHHVLVGAYEDAHADAGLAETGGHVGEEVEVGRGRRAPGSLAWGGSRGRGR